MNTEEETCEDARRLAPIVKQSLNEHPLIVVGYSGDADDLFSACARTTAIRRSCTGSAAATPPRRTSAASPREADRQYAEAVRLRPDLYQALSNWGNVLFERRKRASGPEAPAFFDAAVRSMLRQ